MSQEYEFWIDAYSPKTIAMKRLGEYMARLGKLLGQEDRVHFKEVREGSTTLAYEVEPEADQKILARINNIDTADAANDATSAHNELNDMLRYDDAVAEVRKIENGVTKPVLRLAGREIPKPQKIGPFTEPATFKGHLIRLEGGDATKHAGIKDAQGRVWSGEMKTDLAIQMREFLFELVMVEGLAKWIRNEEGIWELKGFEVSGCKPLPKDTLEDDITALRNIPGNKWKEMDDPIGIIRESRNDDDEIH